MMRMERMNPQSFQHFDSVNIPANLDRSAGPSLPLGAVFLRKLQSKECHWEAMKKLSASSMVASGMSGLGLEIAKNAIIGLHG
jgi:hypothetical protein